MRRGCLRPSFCRRVIGRGARKRALILRSSLGMIADISSVSVDPQIQREREEVVVCNGVHEILTGHLPSIHANSNLVLTQGM